MNQYNRIHPIQVDNHTNFYILGQEMGTPALINNQKELAKALSQLANELNDDPEDTMLRLFRAQMPKAMVTITELMLDPNSPPSVRLKAAEHIMGRGIGPITGKLTIKSASDKLYDEIIELEVIHDDSEAA